MPNSRKRDLLYPYKDEARVLSKIRVTLIEKEKRIFEKIYIATRSVHTKRGNLKTHQSPPEDHVIIVTSSFSKSTDFKMISVHTKTKSQRFKFLRFEKLRFRDGLEHKVGLNVEIKLFFSRSTMICSLILIT